MIHFLYELACNPNIPLDTRYETLRMMQIERNKSMRGRPKPIKQPKQPQHIRSIIAEIGEDNYTYIINHYGRPRTAVAKKIGIQKFRLNMLYIMLFGKEIN